MVYNIGDVIICKETINSQCLEMTNPCFDIKPGVEYIVIDKNDNNSWYELASCDDAAVLNAWNEDGHQVLDEYFEIAHSSSKGKKTNGNALLNKKKYVLFEKDDCEWQMLYCNSHKEEESDEEILRSMTSCKFVGKFDAKAYCYVNSGGIKNDARIYIINEEGIFYLWQVGRRVSDMEDFIIPHTYYIRKIGIIVA